MDSWTELNRQDTAGSEPTSPMAQHQAVKTYRYVFTERPSNTFSSYQASRIYLRFNDGVLQARNNPLHLRHLRLRAQSRRVRFLPSTPILACPRTIQLVDLPPHVNTDTVPATSRSAVSPTPAASSRPSCPAPSSPPSASNTAASPSWPLAKTSIAIVG